MSSLLNVVLSHERFPYLRNTVESLLEFFRHGDTLIMDDGSKGEDVLGYLRALEARGVAVARRKKGDFGDKQGLYPSMNAALDYATEHGYELIQFVQDDMQFMWHDPTAVEGVREIFRAHRDAVTVCPVFFSELRNSGPGHIEPMAAPACYRNNRYWMSDVGFFQTRTLVNAGFSFVDEGESSEYWRSAGRRLYYPRFPFLAFIPWPASFRFGKRISRLRAPPQKYYLRPMGPSDVARLKARPVEQIPFQERYCTPWGWGALAPYWYTTPNPRDYVANVMRTWRHGPRLFPHWRASGWPRYFAPGLFAAYPRMMREAISLARERLAGA